MTRPDQDWEKLPSDAPSAMCALLKRTLVKERKQRLQAIGEARLILEKLGALQPAEPPSAPARSVRPWKWIAASAALAVAVGSAAWFLKPTPVLQRPVVRFDTTFPQAKGKNLLPMAAISRDGSKIAFRAGGQPNAAHPTG